MPTSVPRTIGRTFGKLTVIERLEALPHRCYRFLCQCECGGQVEVHSSNLYGGHTRSCGCLLPQKNQELRITHGMRWRAEYSTWCAIKQRCSNPNATAYRLYGGRGIEMCAEWAASFEAFFRDMGTRPNGTSIDRIDVNKGYAPGNCRWASSKVQGRNRRVCKTLTYLGRTKTVAEWAEETGINLKTLCTRLERGWPVGRALEEAVCQ